MSFHPIREKVHKPTGRRDGWRVIRDQREFGAKPGARSAVCAVTRGQQGEFDAAS
jgi:hypothetical protein